MTTTASISIIQSRFSSIQTLFSIIRSHFSSIRSHFSERFFSLYMTIMTNDSVIIHARKQKEQHHVDAAPIILKCFEVRMALENSQDGTEFKLG